MEYGITTHVPSLVTVLPPSVIRAVSITLSLSVEMTYGFTIREFNVIRVPYCFTPLHISLVTSFLRYIVFA